MSADRYVILWQDGVYKGIVGPYTEAGATSIRREWTRKRRGRRAKIVVASSYDDAYQKTIGLRANPLSTKNVLLGVGAIGALGVIVYALNASTKSAAPAPGAGGGGLNFAIPSSAIDVGPAQSGTTIQVGIGQQVAITVPAAAPGYRWNIAYAGPSVMGAPKGASDSTSLVELYTVQTTGQQSVLFTQIDLAGNINPSAPEYSFAFSSSLLSPIGGKSTV